MSSENFREFVYSVVKTIPEGTVLSYGDVAALAGKPRAARQVGQIAKRGSADLPWHRVVKSDGGLAAGFAWGGADQQQRMLEAEGIEFANGRIKKFELVRLCSTQDLWGVHQTVEQRNKEPELAQIIPPLIVVVGETASGKSSLSMKIAQRYNGEIINADSWNVYKGMDIGTAKPNTKDRSLVKHHLIDSVRPDEDFTAAVFKEMAINCIEKIESSKKLAIMVGGNGLYIDSVLFDYSFLPPGSNDQRARLNLLTIDQLLDLINEHGYDLTGIDTRNKRRLIRLIENKGRRPTKKELRKNTLVLGLRINRTKLRANIENRVETMFRQGLRKEVDNLVNLYGWDNEAMKGIGYNEFRAYYNNEISMVKVKQRIIRNTLALAKRQRTWFKKNRHIVWIEDEDQAFMHIDRFLNTL